MSTNKNSRNKPVTIPSITVFLILIYILLFEYIWVTQSFIPKPSLLFDSFLSLWSEYNLLDAFIETTEVIFPAMVFVIIFLEILFKVFLGAYTNFRGLKNIIEPFKYFSFFFVALLLNFVFPQSLLVEFLFAVLFVTSKLLKIVLNESDLVAEEYILSAKSLGLSKNQIISKVIWKSLKPKVYGNLVAIHTQLWIAVLVYEFIGTSIGIGGIYRMAFNFNDLLAIVSLGVFVSVVILTANSIIKIVLSKLIFWK